MEFLYSVPCGDAEVFIQCMYIWPDGEGECDLLLWRCKSA